MIRGAFVIFCGLLIDGLQAFISVALAAMAATGGTLGGSAIGCAAGNTVAGSTGCAVGGFVLGFLGTFLNAAVAVVAIPFGIVLGIVINICLTLVLGSAFLLILVFMDMFYPKLLLPALGETIPGLNNAPFWTILAVRSVLHKKELGIASLILTPGETLSNITTTVTQTRGRATQTPEETNPRLAGRPETAPTIQEDAPQEEEKRERSPLLSRSVDGIQPSTKQATHSEKPPRPKFTV